MPAHLFFHPNISKRSSVFTFSTFSPTQRLGFFFSPSKASVPSSCSSEKDEDEDAAALRPRCSDFFSKTVNQFLIFLFFCRHLFFVFCLPDGRVFDLYLLYIFSVTFIRIVGLIKDFSGCLFFLIEDFGVALWSHDCLASDCQRGCAAAVVRLGTCVSEAACTRASSTPSPHPLHPSSSHQFHS